MAIDKQVERRRRITPHKTRKGLLVDLSWEPVPQPDEAPYRKYLIHASLASGKTRLFTALIRRSIAKTDAEAEAFLLTDPLSDIRAQLESADATGIPIFEPVTREDWWLY